MNEKEQQVKDADLNKGAVENTAPEERENSEPAHTRLAGQLPHRHKPEEMDTEDTDFPEPGQSPEHS